MTINEFSTTWPRMHFALAMRK